MYENLLVFLTAVDGVSNILHSISTLSFCKRIIIIPSPSSIISVQDGLSPLYVACYNGHKLTVDILLKNGANVNLATTVSTLCTEYLPIALEIGE